MMQEISIAIIAIVLLACGLLFLEKAKRLRATGIAVHSVIIKNNYKVSGNDTRGIYYPVVKFQTANNEWIVQELNTGQSPPRKEGTRINILYDPKNPQEIYIDSAFHLTQLPWILITVGVGMLTFFCLGIFEVINVL